MPFLAKEHVSIPSKDILSWIYDEPTLEQDTPIFIDANDPSSSITAAQAKKSIRQLIAGLKHAGIRQGDTVLIHSFNNIYYPITVLGIIGCGASFCGTNPSYTTGELKYAINKCQAKLVLCDPDVIGEGFVNATKACGIPTSNIFVFDTVAKAEAQKTAKDFISWRTLFTHGESDWHRFNDEKSSRDTTAFLFFSSGTTGLPKATPLSHYNLIAEHVLAFEHPPRPYSMRRLVVLPMFHVATAPSTHISALKAGHVQVIMRRYEPTTFINMVEKHSITDLTLVPPQVTSLLMLPIPIEHRKEMLTSLKNVWGGGAPLSASTQNAFSALLPSSSPFTQIWAMTETSCFASLITYPTHDATGSVGRFLPNIDVKLLDDAGTDISAYDTPGELAIRGPTVTSGYVGQDRSVDFDDEGYFRTGDVMRCDGKTGLWYVVERKKDLIKVRGFQVAPAEIEGVLLEHPDVVDAAVIGVGNREGDSEMPRAFVVKRDRAVLGVEEVKKWVEGRLARYKWLDGGVVFVEDLPKTASGKLLKRVLREGYRGERGAKL